MEKLRDQVILILMQRMGVKDPVVTDVQRAYFSAYSYRQLVVPAVIEYVESGKTLAEAAIKWRLTRRQVERIMEKKEAPGGASRHSQDD